MLWTLPFLLLVVVILPLLAISSYRNVRSPHAELPSRIGLYFNLLFVQLIVGGFAALAAFGADVPVTWNFRIEFGTIGPAVGLVVIALVGAIWISVRIDRSCSSNPNLGALLCPISMADWLLWGAAMIAAAVVEEYAYRGVFFGLALRVSESWWLAAFAGALIFGIGHASQGWAGSFASALFAIGMQWLVFHANGLLIAIAAHLAFDVVIQLLAPGLAGSRPANDAEQSDPPKPPVTPVQNGKSSPPAQ